MKQENSAWGRPHAPALLRWGRKTLSLFLSVVLCLSMLPATALAEESTPTADEAHPHTAETQHPVCIDSSTCTDPDHGHEAIHWTEWSTADAMPSETGNYYLTTNVTLTDSWAPAAGTVLCLNGYSITRVNSEKSGYVIELPYRSGVSNNSFTLTDCAETQGVITHAEGSHGGGVYADSQAPFYMYGGTISGNTGYWCGGVYAFKFYLYGGTISGNYGGIKEDNTTNATGGGGVYIYSTFDMYGGTIENNVAKGAKGGGVRLDDHIQYFNIYGGAIRNNTAEYGGGVYFIENTIRISGNAAITDNTASINGGGIYGQPQYHPSQADVYVSGAARIAGNKKAGSMQNVLLINNQTSSGQMYAKLYVAGSLTSGAYIGVTRTDGETVVAKGADTYSITQEDAGYFHSDNEEYKIVLNGNQITLEPDDNPVASLNGQNYNSLQTAIDKAQEMDGNPTITLLRDATPYAISVTSGEFTLDLAGHKLAFTTNDSAITVKGESADNPINLTIKDSGGNGCITSSGIGLNVRENAVLTIESGKYSSQTSSPVSAIYGTVVVEDGQFTGETGISVYQGNLTIQGGTYTGTKYGVRNTGVYTPSGTITIESGTFYGGEKSLYFQTQYGNQELSGGTYQNGMQIITTNGKLSDLLKSPAYMFKTSDGQALSDDAASQSSYAGYLTVDEKAIASMTITEDQNLTYGAVPTPTITVNALTADNVEAEVNYKWSLTKTVPAEGTPTTETLSNTTKEYTVPSDLTAGVYKYTVRAFASDGSESTASCTVTVNRRPVQINGLYLENKVYDGTTTAKIAYNGDTPTLVSYNNKDNIGVLEKDKGNVTVKFGTGEYRKSEAGAWAGVYTGFELQGEAAGNYELKFSSAVPIDGSENTIFPRLITPDFSGITVTKVYDGTTAPGTVSGSIGFGADEWIVSDKITLTATAGSHTDENAGENKSVQLTVVLDGEDKGNYTLMKRDDWRGTYQKQFTFDRASITKSPQAALKITDKRSVTYGDEPFALTTSGGSGTGAVTWTATGAVSVDENGKVTVLTTGEASVTAEKAADSNHTDSVSDTWTFTVSQKNISDATVTVGGSYTYTGSEIQPPTEQVSVKLGGTTLAEGTDYTVTYTNNINATSESNKAIATITGKGNYTGTASGNFEIAPKILTDQEITVTGIESKTFTGSAIEQLNLVVKNGDTELTLGTDYTVIYESNINAGNAAKVIITGKGNYADKVEKTFTITAKALENGMITDIPAQTYTGSAIEPTLTAKYGTIELVKGADYTVEYTANTNAGVATVTITGTGNYSGTATANFTINKADQSLSKTDMTATYGAIFEVTPITGNQGEVTYAVKSGSESLLTKGEDGKFTAKSGTGTAYIKATAAETANYNVTTIDIPVVLSKATLTAKADDKSIYVNGTVPTELTVSYTGFVNGDTKDTVVAKDATASIAAEVDGKTVGSFDITTNTDTKLKSGMENNYTVAVQNGTLTVSRRSSGGGGGVSQVTYPVAAPDKTENGSVTVSPKSAKQGDTVTITVTPDAGYALKDVRVTDKSGKDVSLTKKSDTQYTFVMPAGQVEVNASFAKEGAAQSKFVDVKESDYFYDAVQWAAAQGITSGTDAEHFSPNASCTRAQIVTFLWRAAGSPEPKQGGSFTDVAAESYYAKAVAWAVENGITTGTGAETFSPDATCTREQAVAFLYRAAGSPAVSGGSAFRDVADSAYYANAVAWAERNGITGGIGGGLFGSGNDCTRGQIVTFLYRANQQ